MDIELLRISDEILSFIEFDTLCIPNEIWLYIFNFLDFKSRTCIAKTSYHFNTIVETFKEDMFPRYPYIVWVWTLPTQKIHPMRKIKQMYHGLLFGGLDIVNTKTNHIPNMHNSLTWNNPARVLHKFSKLVESIVGYKTKQPAQIAHSFLNLINQCISRIAQSVENYQDIQQYKKSSSMIQKQLEIIQDDQIWCKFIATFICFLYKLLRFF